MSHVATNGPKARLLPAPELPPGPEEVERHNATHTPHAAWCSICREARSKEGAHRRQDDEKRDREEEMRHQVQVDYTFATEEKVSMTILTLRVRTTGWSNATPVPAKGAIPYAVEWLTSSLRALGAQPWRIHTDAEEAVSALAVAAAERLPGSTVIRAPRASHASIGAVERYHAELHGTVRALRADLEQRLNRKVPLTCGLYAWLVKHSAWVIPRYS
eukprot:5514666-Amphidinium_carterae.1